MAVGVDIVENKRVKLRDRFIKRILSNNELNIFLMLLTKKRKIEFLAGRWACKEAIYKVVSKNFEFANIDIGYDENGTPIVQTKGLEAISVSISHEKKYTIAIAIL